LLIVVVQPGLGEFGLHRLQGYRLRSAPVSGWASSFVISVASSSLAPAHRRQHDRAIILDPSID